MADDLARRIGRFTLPSELVREKPSQLLSLFAECVIVRCDSRYDLDGFEYYALCPHFREVPQGACCDTYHPYQTRAEDGTISLSFRRPETDG